jgi:hypothetical protein
MISTCDQILKTHIENLILEFNDIWQKIKVKLLNYKTKYNDNPKLLILNHDKFFIIKAIQYSDLLKDRNDRILLGSVALYFSNRINHLDFEIY